MQDFPQSKNRFGRLRISRILLSVGLLGGAASWSGAQEKATGTESLRSAVGQWVAVMQKIQEEQGRWTREKQILELNREGLEQEIVDLEQTIASTQSRLDSTSKEQQDNLAKKREYDEAREILAVSMTEAEAEARRVIPLIPDFFLTENTQLAVAVQELKRTADLTDEQKAKNLGARLSAVNTVLSEAEKFQMQIWVRGEQRKLDGVEKLVTTIYFGLSTAFSADEQQTIALRGTSSENGWSFERLDDKSAPGQILELIAVASLKGEIKFVEVPLKLR